MSQKKNQQVDNVKEPTVDAKNQQVNNVKEPTVDAQPKLDSVVNGDLEKVKVAPVAKEVPATTVRQTSAVDRVVNHKNTPGQLTPTADTSAQIIVRSVIDEYITGMAPAKPITESAGANFQLKLWRAIEQVLRSPAELFHVNMNTLLEEIKKNRDGVFSEKYVFRFFHRIELPETQLKSFERLLNLFITTCDPSTRELALKQVDMEKTLEKLPNEETRQRIFAYYHNK